MAIAASKIRVDRWMTLIILTVLTAYFYVLMEWLFFTTKPSFMSTLSLLDNLKVLWVAPIPLVAVGIAWVLAFWFLSLDTKQLN